MNAIAAKGDSILARALEIFLALLLVLALLSIQALIGGTRLLFAVPAYGLLAVIGLLGLALLRTRRPAPDQLCLWSAALFFGYIIVRAVLSPVPYLAQHDIYSVVAGLVVYFFTSCVLTSAKMRMSIFACLLAAALVHVFVGAIQFRSGNNFMLIPFLQRFNYGHRASGFYVCPNHLAGLLEVLGVFGLSMVCWSRWPLWAKLLIGYATIICYVGVIISGSRAGYLSVAASWVAFGLLGMQVLRGGGSKLMLRIGGAGVLAAALAVAAGVFLVRQSDSLNERTQRAVVDRSFRLDLAQAAIEQWKLAPVLGTGSRTYQFYGRKFRTERMQLDPIYTHNDYLQLLAEYGLVGAAMFVIFFTVHWRRGWIEARRLGPKRIAISHRLVSNSMALNIGALAALIAYVVHSAFDFNLHIPANVLLLAFVFGMVANPGVSHESLTEKGWATLRYGRWLMALLAIVLGIQMWQRAPGEYYAEKARTAVRDYRFLSAISFAREALRYEPRNPLIYYYLGRARTLGGDAQRDAEARASFYGAAVPAYAQARELAPLDKTYAVELAITYDSLQRFEEAEWLYTEARALDPRSTSLKEYYRAHLDRWKEAKPAGAE